METSAQGITAPAAIYEIAGKRFEVGGRGFADAVADAHAAHQRPRCMCLVEGVEMYVARLGEGYIVRPEQPVQAPRRAWAVGIAPP